MHLESNVALRSSAPVTVGTVFLVVRFPRQRSAAEAPQAGERGEVLSRMEEMECVIDVGDAVQLSTTVIATTLLRADHPLAAGPAQELQALAVAAGATNSINTVSHNANTPRPAGTSHGLESLSCSLLQSVAVFCSLLQSVAACCSLLQSLAVSYSLVQSLAACCSVLQRVAACCTQCRVVLLPWASVCCNTRQHTPTHCITQQHTATHCSIIFDSMRESVAQRV